uniref:(northern house mosquito) hypothetical protein n=1 Tax=Culex pipiens TaxID=7175 RepID=A0A8D8IGX5_CULPI
MAAFPRLVVVVVVFFLRAGALGEVEVAGLAAVDLLGDGFGDGFGEVAAILGLRVVVVVVALGGWNSSRLRILWFSSKLTRRGEACFLRLADSSSVEDPTETLLRSSGMTSKRWVYLPLLAERRGVVALLEGLVFRLFGDRLVFSLSSSGDLMNLTPTSSGLLSASINRSAIMRSTFGLLPAPVRGLFSRE